MTLGPEFVRGLRGALSGRLPWRIHKAEGGDSWVALKLGHDDLWLLFSWGSGTGGCCLADGGSVSVLRKGAPARTPLVEALRSRFVKGDLTGVRQIGHDRILEFEVRRRVAAGAEVRYSLVLEATEPLGNLILLGADRRIEELARHEAPDRNPYRTLLPG
ncbi:MAG: NFACT family protein, partial [Fretibacterium sp.]